MKLTEKDVLGEWMDGGIDEKYFFDDDKTEHEKEVCDECGYYEDTTNLHFDDCSKLEKMGLCYDGHEEIKLG